MDWDEATRRQFLAQIEEQALRLTRLVGDLLDLSRIEGGAVRPDRDWYDVAETLTGVLADLGSPCGHHPIVLDVGPDAGVALFDHVHLRQVLQNLLENAAKFSPEGCPIRVAARRVIGQIEISVEDHGPGIHPRSVSAGSKNSTEEGRRRAAAGAPASGSPSARGSSRRMVAASAPRRRQAGAPASSLPCRRPQAAPSSPRRSGEGWPAHHERAGGRIVPVRVLAVDDEPEILRTLRLILTGHGYDVITAETGEDALAAIARRLPDVILLDLMLPGIDGLEVITHVRQRSAVPIIVLSARGEELTKVQALDLGADDYLAKPFGAKELLARVRVALRHAAGALGAPVAQFGDLRIDFERRSVAIAGREVALTPKENAVLLYLVANAGRVLTHRDILREVWGPEYTGELQYLRNIMVSLRRKLERDPEHPAYLVTEPGTGYRFRALHA